jgi:hypothetical protein
MKNSLVGGILGAVIGFIIAGGIFVALIILNLVLGDPAFGNVTALRTFIEKVLSSNWINVLFVLLTILGFITGWKVKRNKIT